MPPLKRKRIGLPKMVGWLSGIPHCMLGVLDCFAKPWLAYVVGRFCGSVEVVPVHHLVGKTLYIASCGLLLWLS